MESSRPSKRLKHRFPLKTKIFAFIAIMILLVGIIVMGSLSVSYRLTQKIDEFISLDIPLIEIHHKTFYINSDLSALFNSFSTNFLDPPIYDRQTLIQNHEEFQSLAKELYKVISNGISLLDRALSRLDRSEKYNKLVEINLNFRTILEQQIEYDFQIERFFNLLYLDKYEEAVDLVPAILALELTLSRQLDTLLAQAASLGRIRVNSAQSLSSHMIIGLLFLSSMILAISILFGTRFFSHIRAILDGLVATAHTFLENRQLRTSTPVESNEIADILRAFETLDAILQETDSQLKSKEEVLQSMNAQLRSLSNRIIDIQEKERLHLSQTIHDDLGQQITALKLQLYMAKNRVAQCAQHSEPVEEKMDTAIHIADSLVASIRRMAWQLRPNIIDELGLKESLVWHTRKFLEGTSIRADVRYRLNSAPDKMLTTTLFRIYQELLNNVVKHAQATTVNIELSETDTMIHLVVVDDGVGLTSASKLSQDSLGLVGIRERLIGYSGQLTLTSPSDATGTMAKVTIPKENL